MKYFPSPHRGRSGEGRAGPYCAFLNVAGTPPSVNSFVESRSPFKGGLPYVTIYRMNPFGKGARLFFLTNKALRITYSSALPVAQFYIKLTVCAALSEHTYAWGWY